MSDLDDIRARAKELRSLGHRAVTEGVNLKYVELARRGLYEAADELDALLARIDTLERSLQATRNALTGTQGVRDDYKARALTAEARIDTLEEETREEHVAVCVAECRIDTLTAERNQWRLAAGASAEMIDEAEARLAEVEADRLGEIDRTVRALKRAEAAEARVAELTKALEAARLYRERVEGLPPGTLASGAEQ
jgi:chromosome segregation ATPase